VRFSTKAHRAEGLAADTGVLYARPVPALPLALGRYDRVGIDARDSGVGLTPCDAKRLCSRIRRAGHVTGARARFKCSDA
jgi:hypothetical protein